MQERCCCAFHGLQSPSFAVSSTARLKHPRHTASVSLCYLSATCSIFGTAQAWLNLQIVLLSGSTLLAALCALTLKSLPQVRQPVNSSATQLKLKVFSNCNACHVGKLRARAELPLTYLYTSCAPPNCRHVASLWLASVVASVLVLKVSADVTNSVTVAVHIHCSMQTHVVIVACIHCA